MFGMQQQLGQNQQPLNLFGNQNNLEKAPEKTPEEIEKQKRKRGKTCKIHRRDARKRSICNKDP